MNENKPWDVKTLCLSLGGPDDEHGFLRFEIFDDCSFSIYEGEEGRANGGWRREGIDIEAARRLRDFLNFAVPADAGEVRDTAAGVRATPARPRGEADNPRRELERRLDLVTSLYPLSHRGSVPGGAR
jgi:hypothetical protein